MHTAVVVQSDTSSCVRRRQLLPAFVLLLVSIVSACSSTDSPTTPAPTNGPAGRWTLTKAEGKPIPSMILMIPGSGPCCGEGTENIESVTVLSGTLIIRSNHTATLEYVVRYKQAGGNAGAAITEMRQLEWDELDDLRFFESKPCSGITCPTELLVANARKDGDIIHISHAQYLTHFIQYVDNSTFARVR